MGCTLHRIRRALGDAQRVNADPTNQLPRKGLLKKKLGLLLIPTSCPLSRADGVPIDFAEIIEPAIEIGGSVRRVDR